MVWPREGCEVIFSVDEINIVKGACMCRTGSSGTRRTSPIRENANRGKMETNLYFHMIDTSSPLLRTWIYYLKFQTQQQTELASVVPLTSSLTADSYYDIVQILDYNTYAQNSHSLNKERTQNGKSYN